MCIEVVIERRVLETEGVGGYFVCLPEAPLVPSRLGRFKEVPPTHENHTTPLTLLHTTHQICTDPLVSGARGKESRRRSLRRPKRRGAWIAASY